MSDKWKSRDCPLLPGHILHNRYKITREIDTGRFCTVWAATDKDDNQYAIKVFKRGGEYREYFENELLMLGRVGNASNIVRHLDAFVHLYNANPPTDQCSATTLIVCGGEPDCNRYYYPCIVFELLGEHLLRLLRTVDDDATDDTTADDVGGNTVANTTGGNNSIADSIVDGDSNSDGSDSNGSDFYHPTGLNVDAVKRIIRQILHALVYLHKRGLIHTDIKPENIMLDKPIATYTDPNKINVKLGDLGSTTPSSDLFSLSVGTHEYVAPEIIVRGKYSYPSDIWSIGCLIFELITNEPLFDLSDTADSDSESSSEDGSGDESNGSFEDSGSSSASSGDGDEYTTNLHHLILLECVLGPMPRKAVHGKRYMTYFTKKGALKNTLGIPAPPRTNIRTLLADYELSQNDIDGCADLIELCLRYNPTSRITAEHALIHPWLKK